MNGRLAYACVAANRGHNKVHKCSSPLYDRRKPHSSGSKRGCARHAGGVSELAHKTCWAKLTCWDTGMPGFEILIVVRAV